MGTAHLFDVHDLLINLVFKKLSGYFDTNVGSKRDSRSYSKISQSIEVEPCDILFLTDVGEGVYCNLFIR